MRRSLVLTCTALLGAACLKTGSKEPERQVLASIDGLPIYADEFARELERFRLDDEAGLPSAAGDGIQKRVLLDNLIDRRLVLRAAELHNVIVGIDEVEAAYQRMRGGWKEAELEQILRDKDLTQAELKAELRDHLTVRKYFRDHVFSRVAVTDEEIESYLEKHPGMHEVAEQVRARQIVVKTEEEAKGILAEIKKGLAFEDAAMKYSLSPEGKSGGDLGFFARGSMPRVFDEPCFGLEPGQVSAVVASEYGFHIFKVVERRPATPRPIEQVREQVEALLRRDKERGAQASKLTELRSKATIVVQEEQLARIY